MRRNVFAGVLASAAVALALVTLPGGGALAAGLVQVLPSDVLVAQDDPSPSQDQCANPSNTGAAAKPWCEEQTAAGKVYFVADPSADGGGALEFDTRGSGDQARLSMKPAPVTALADITQLSYKTFIRKPSTAAPYILPALTLRLQPPAPASGITARWEPANDPSLQSAASATGAWQSWTTLLSGPGWVVPGDSTVSTFQNLKDKYGSSTITAIGLNQGTGNGGLVARADSLSVNGTVYDFNLPPATTVAVRPAEIDAVVGSACPTTKAFCSFRTSAASLTLDPATGSTGSPQMFTPGGGDYVVLTQRGLQKPLAQFSTLAYDATVLQRGAGASVGYAPAMRINAVNPSPGTPAIPSNVRLYWEPTYAAAGAAGVGLGISQRWTPSSGTGWWSPQNMDLNVPSQPALRGQMGSLGFRQYDATFAEVQASLGGFSVSELGLLQGDGAPGVTANADLLRIDGVIYDFEPPLPPAITTQASPKLIGASNVVDVTGAVTAGDASTITVTLADAAANSITASAAVPAGTAVPYTLRFSTAGLQDGPLSVSAVAVDQRGQTSPTATDTATKDTVSPVFRTLSLTVDASQNAATVSGDLTDASSATLTLAVVPDSGGTPPANQTQSIPAGGGQFTRTFDLTYLNPGPFSVRVSALDAAGNSASSLLSGQRGTASGSGTAPNATPSASAAGAPGGGGATAFASAPGTAGSGNQLSLRVPPAAIVPGQGVRVAIHGSPNAAVQLLAYSRPSTQYRVVRTGTTDATGTLEFVVTPGTNTRLYAHYSGLGTDLDSPSAVIQVQTALSLSAYRDGVRLYHFQGRNLPRMAGQLITLYRIDERGNEIRTAVTRTDSSGVWRIDRAFTGSGEFVFVARTSQTMNNAAGRSNQRLTIIH